MMRGPAGFTTLAAHSACVSAIIGLQMGQAIFAIVHAARADQAALGMARLSTSGMQRQLAAYARNQ